MYTQTLCLFHRTGLYHNGNATFHTFFMAGDGELQAGVFDLNTSIQIKTTAECFY